MREARVDGDLGVEQYLEKESVGAPLITRPHRPRPRLNPVRAPAKLLLSPSPSRKVCSRTHTPPARASARSGADTPSAGSDASPAASGVAGKRTATAAARNGCAAPAAGRVGRA